MLIPQGECSVAYQQPNWYLQGVSVQCNSSPLIIPGNKIVNGQVSFTVTIKKLVGTTPISKVAQDLKAFGLNFKNCRLTNYTVVASNSSLFVYENVTYECEDLA